MRDTVLHLENVAKSFPEASDFEVLKNITFSVQKGEFACILGPTGCGKTILLYLISGFLKKTGGTILINGKPVGIPDTSRIMMFQDYVLFPWKTVYGNVLFGLHKEKIPAHEKHERVMEYLRLVGLEKYRDWHVHKLSGGMRQRVAFARALIAGPEILLMDEPFSSLDSQYRKFLRNNLLNIWQKTGKTILFVTHSINEALYLADTIYILSKLPATVKKVCKVDLPRPRDPATVEFAALAKEIDTYMNEEFATIMEKDVFPVSKLIRTEI